MLTDHHVSDLTCSFWSVNQSHTHTHTESFLWAVVSLILWMVQDCSHSWLPASPLGFEVISRLELNICPSSAFLSWRCVMWLLVGWMVHCFLCQFSRRLEHLLCFGEEQSRGFPLHLTYLHKQPGNAHPLLRKMGPPGAWALIIGGTSWYWFGGGCSVFDVYIKDWVIPDLTSSRTHCQL